MKKKIKKGVAQKVKVALVLLKSQSEYIAAHKGDSVDSLAEATDLPIEIVSAEVARLAKLPKADRFDKYKGTVAMTPAQSMSDDEDYEKNKEKQDQFLSRHEKSIHKIVK